MALLTVSFVDHPVRKTPEGLLLAMAPTNSNSVFVGVAKNEVKVAPCGAGVETICQYLITQGQISGKTKCNDECENNENKVKKKNRYFSANIIQFLTHNMAPWSCGSETPGRRKKTSSLIVDISLPLMPLRPRANFIPEASEG